MRLGFGPCLRLVHGEPMGNLRQPTLADGPNHAVSEQTW